MRYLGKQNAATSTLFVSVVPSDRGGIMVDDGSVTEEEKLGALFAKLDSHLNQGRKKKALKAVDESEHHGGIPW